MTNLTTKQKKAKERMKMARQLVLLYEEYNDRFCEYRAKLPYPYEVQYQSFADFINYLKTGYTTPEIVLKNEGLI